MFTYFSIKSLKSDVHLTLAAHRRLSAFQRLCSPMGLVAAVLGSGALLPSWPSAGFPPHATATEATQTP